ncbi:glycosyltransferase family 4 protein [Kribbella sp. NPDC050281]|uniref:glycosyltransferase family 4 protein n=1 Tax=Kribbella sp. NPDC050281 TaxID=3155515 RepID=UPI0033E6B211
MAGPHVVMIVANDIANDTRVLKEAVALGQAGRRVTLLGVSASGELKIDTIDAGVVMIRLPGKFLLRDDRNRRRRVRRARRLLMVSKPAPVRKALVTARLADLKAESGRAVAQRKAGAVGPLAFKAGTVRRALQRRQLTFSGKGAGLLNRAAQFEARKATRFWQRWDLWMTQQKRPINWRRVIPEADDYETIFASVLDRLMPDVLHAHDMHVIGVASRAAGRAALRGRTVKVVYDAHEYVPGLSTYPPRTPRLVAAWAQHERDYIRTVDRVVTVSPAIARTLHTRYKLDREPSVVINSPQLIDLDHDAPDIRSAIGLADDVPLIVYSGGITRARGVETAISSLPQLPDVHLAVVCVPTTEMKPVDELRALAAKVGVVDRVHYLNPVAPNDVTSFLRTADLGLIPILRYPSHEMALPNKVFEYTFAGLPVVTSNMPTLEEFVGKTGIGEVFEAENPTDLAAKVSKVLADPKPYRERAASPELRHEMSWEAQADNLRALYDELLGPVDGVEIVKPRLVVGPVDADGAPSAWVREIDEAEVVGRRLTAADLDGITHVVMEDWKSVLGSSDITTDLPLLAAARIKHGVVVYGRPDRPATRERATAYNGTVFVTDEAMLDSVPDSEWLPTGEQGTEILRKFIAD